MLAGLKEDVQLACGTTVTVAVQVLLVPAPLFTVSVHVWVAVGDLTEVPVAPDAVPLPRLPVQVYGALLSASFVKVQDKVDVEPVVIEAGVKEAVQLGAGPANTTAEHVFVAPKAFATVSVHVWVAVGDKTDEPVAPAAVPLPRLPVQL